MTEQEAKNKLASVARAEVGYHEGANNFTKYAAEPMIAKLYGWVPQNQPWCGTFVNWCFLTAFGYDIGSKLTYGGSAACKNAAQLFMSNGSFGSTPALCDQAFFYSGGDINHTGIVVEVNGSSFTTIEGNYSDKVSLVTHNIGKSDVAGFGKPCWEIVADEKTEDPAKPAKEENSHNWKPGTLKYGAKGTDVYVLQSLLIARKFYTNNDRKEIDGDFGAKTQAAVNSAKQFYGMMANGECDSLLWKRLLERGD